MFKNITQLAQMLCNTGQISDRIEKAKNELGKRQIRQSSRCGSVVVEMTGLGRMLGIRLSEDLVESKAHASMERLISETVDEALREARQLHLATIRQLTGDLPVPGLDRLIDQLNDDK